MLRNVELKVRLLDIAAARCVARRVASESLGILQQKDTYFDCRRGRLKLRETEGRPAQLVWYARADLPDPKPSDYLLAAVSEPQVTKEALEHALGIRVVVEKRREVFLYENVRMHLDEVSKLGDFLEFEAVLSSEVDDRRARAQLEYLIGEFRLPPSDFLEASYSDLLEAHGQRR